ncbi:unnamed protein product [Brassica rapa]|uniref:Uncharacterized protein n=2 Tax=Brassica TaxID=3705 RepID=A0A3P5YTA7_BRACM|nr:unnamed protein product [Brassica napus]CAG7867456.1 unnamed protein product [Brassica rapa]VDC64380.1 unnamed protein product [Brassica rapa]
MSDQDFEGSSEPVDLINHPSGIVPTLQNIVSTDKGTEDHSVDICLGKNETWIPSKVQRFQDSEHRSFL